MGVYRKIEVRIWNDQRFCALSDDAKLLFLHFLTNPKLLQIGAIPCRAEVIALDLGWDIKRFDKGFAELFKNGMAKRSERVVFVTNFLKYNPPANPNVVKHYNAELEEVPECDLLDDIKRSVVEVCSNKGNSYLSALEQDFFKYRSPETDSETVKQTVSETVSQTVYQTNNNSNNNNNTNTKKKGETPEGVSEQTWIDFTQLRKAKRAPVTATAITRIKNEADKAGISLDEALSICCEKGWQSFKAEWLANSRTVTVRANPLENNARFADRLIRDPLFCQTFFADRYDYDEMKQEVTASLAHPTTYNQYKPHLIRLGLLKE